MIRLLCLPLVGLLGAGAVAGGTRSHPAEGAVFPALPVAVAPGQTADEMAAALVRDGMRVVEGHAGPGRLTATSADGRRLLVATTAPSGVVTRTAYRIVASEASAEEATESIRLAAGAAGWIDGASGRTDLHYSRDGRRMEIRRLFECDTDFPGESFYVVIELTDERRDAVGYLRP